MIEDRKPRTFRVFYTEDGSKTNAAEIVVCDGSFCAIFMDILEAVEECRKADGMEYVKICEISEVL